MRAGLKRAFSSGEAGNREAVAQLLQITAGLAALAAMVSLLIGRALFYILVIPTTMPQVGIAPACHHH
ncbi:Aspartate carbamoyltransferase, fragment [Oleispira antarctica RB-8]|uniref:Aspartate carbamoyltransferase n=1 Tax=Oleispira antarctica RB-8 TaxID=698738 RepID=R4YLN3_OLEAN|nr:Aspartate carbamoyltransferase, fragment [Oleispira antarctica RB-8]